MDILNSIFITLGHNSSVIYYDQNKQIIGYEEERLTKIKSDSSYPKLALEKVLSQLSENQKSEITVFISHWFSVYDIEEFPTKYFNHTHFGDLVKKYDWTVLKINEVFSHHDAHHWSTISFLESNSFKLRDIAANKMYSIVADGFGTNQEVLSIYDPQSKLIKRFYGFENSLGLMYQYATSFCGMKENQDEYKFLGYESKVMSYINKEQFEELTIAASTFASRYVHDNLIVESHKEIKHNTYLDLDSLMNAKDKFYIKFRTILDDFSSSSNETDESRAIIGYYIQKCIELTVTGLLDALAIESVCLSGGCFLNVKLNNLILNKVKGYVCVNPLSGDQGAAIGLFRYYSNRTFYFGNLCYGIRDLQVTKSIYNLIPDLLKRDIVIAKSNEEFVYSVSKLLDEGFIVNVLQGNMEFGPRALCNTSTLASPTKENAKYINEVNKRNEVMPMAPVILESRANYVLDAHSVEKVVGSDRFMIMAHDIRGSVLRMMIGGVIHKRPVGEFFTCRPQIITDEFSNIYHILNKLMSSYPRMDMLINTSFNTHGVPILYSVDDAIEDFIKQKKFDTNGNRLKLVILEN